ncbi:Uncharacterised protein [Helicobacter fennelliae]|uniref:CopG family transcriptional regulator n=1 Tax=Helicobacter fennelliae TaxID=215 RepID=A0A2X3GME5_9HELI|nr:hypothetical protein [Helicobacter fennelliae]SQC36290.1 Uncharacterised protein [Helicobacter fennelliae]
MAGLRDIKKTNSFKSVELERKSKQAGSANDFINQAEGETSKPKAKGKLGAPRKSEADKRTQKIMCYFTEKEIVKIQEMAEDKNMKVNEFLRFKIFS